MRYIFENKENHIMIKKIYYLLPTPHLHSHLELVYLTKGSCIAYTDDEGFLCNAGDFFFAFPYQTHYYQLQEEMEGYIFIFTPDIFNDLKELFKTKIPATPIIRLNYTPLDLEKRLEMILNKNLSDNFLDKTISKALLFALSAELLSNAALTDIPAGSDNIKRLLHFCSEHYTEPLSLNSISQELYLNKYYISHVFNDKLHVSFTDFINNLRIEHACNYLEKGANITEIALSSGFSSVRTFNRVFMKQMNMSPRDYIKQKNMYII